MFYLSLRTYNKKISCHYILYLIPKIPVVVRLGFLDSSVVKESACNAGDLEMVASILGQEDSLEEKIMAHSSILVRKISWTEEPGGLQSRGHKSIGYE